MGKLDDPKFDKPYSVSSSGKSSSFESEIKADAPSAAELARAVFADFDVKTNGVAWWTEYTEFGDKRRIFVGDYLWQSAISISTNLAEAKLHLMGLQDAAEQAHSLVKRAVTVDRDGNADVKLPPRNSVREELPHRMEALHSAGLFRAMGSVFDCLAANIIGVAGISRPIKKADFSGLMKWLKEQIEKGLLGKDHPHFELHSKLVAIIGSCGPQHWFEWVNSYRNVIVHRGRRTEFRMLVPKPTGLFSLDGTHVVNTSEALLLVRDPDDTDVEGWLNFSGGTLLNESSVDTFEGAFESARMLAEEVSAELLKIWNARKANPQLILQPAIQWKLDETGDWSFNGFRPDSVKFEAEMIKANGVSIHRMQVAAVDDLSFPKWKTFT